MMIQDKNIVQLNYQQQESVDFLLNYMKQPYWEVPKYVAIKGTAGTGKTFAVVHLLEELKKQRLVDKVAIIAPTNSACKSLRKAFGHKASHFDIRTIASALGLKPVIAEDGKEQFLIKSEAQTDLFKEDPLSNIDFLIIDEGSMVSKENALMIEHKIPNKCRVLILEDQYQLPPVNEKEIYYDVRVDKNFYELTKTERYDPNSFIYKVISHCRQMVIDLEPRRENEGYAESELRSKAAKKFKLLEKFPDSVPENDKGHGYFVYKDKQEAMINLSKQVRVMLSTQKYDYVRCVCWRNKEVDRINQYVRDLAIPFGAEMSVTSGELFVTNGAVKRAGEVKEEDKIVYPSATNLIVCNSKSVTLKIESLLGFHFLYEFLSSNNKLTEWKIWETTVYDPDDNLTGNPPRQFVNILDYRYREEHEDVSKLIHKYISSLPYRTTEWFHAIDILKQFQSLVDPIRPSYALTGYGVQGTSFDIVYINNSDITYKYRDANIKNRTLFVGCSRAKKRINVF